MQPRGWQETDGGAGRFVRESDRFTDASRNEIEHRLDAGSLKGLHVVEEPCPGELVPEFLDRDPYLVVEVLEPVAPGQEGDSRLSIDRLSYLGWALTTLDGWLWFPARSTAVTRYQ